MRSKKRFFTVVVGYCGANCKTAGNRKYGCSDYSVVVFCTEKQLETVATAIGEGRLADSLVVFEGNEGYSRYEQPYRIFWDCM